MKLKRIAYICVIAAVFIVTQTVVVGMSATVDKTVTVASTATKPITPGALLDDFRYAAALNLWSCNTSVYSSQNPVTTDAKCAASYNSSIAYGGSGYSLQLDYNVNRLDSYAGYVSGLGSGSLSSYKSVSFYVKGAVGGEYFKVEFKTTGADNNTNHAAVYITDYLDGGVTTAWQQVTIPLHNFANISNWSSMKEFIITFENYATTTNGSLKSGTVYIDNIQFNTTAVTVARIDHFGDKLGPSALGANQGDIGDPNDMGSSFSATSGTYYNYANSLKLTYNVSPAWSYCGHYMIIGGGNDGWTKVAHNFSEFTYFSFWVRANTTATNPKGLKIEIHDFADVGNGEPFYVITMDSANPITTSWKQYKIPLSSFKDWDSVVLDKTKIQEIVFNIEWVNAANSVGTIYIDGIQFEK